VSTYINPCIIGLDLSLTATGIAHPAGEVEVIRPDKIEKDIDGMPRIELIRERIAEIVASHTHIELVVIEGYSYGSHLSYAREMGELGGVVRNHLYQERVPYLDVAPNKVKKVATGNGKAGKTEVVQAAEKRLGYEGHDDNESDALWLRAIGWFLMGETPCTIPVAQLDALEPLRHIVPTLAPRRRT
jgi:Holliday junction resolvasome RuvABC endonuclease subunit